MALKRKRGEWSPQEIDVITRLFGVLPLPRLSRRLGRTEQSVVARAELIFKGKRRRGNWRPQDEERLQLMVGVADLPTIAMVIGRSRRETQKALNGMKRRVNRGAWGAEDLVLLRRIYGSRADEAVALALGRTLRAVRIMAGRLCLEKDKEYLKNTGKETLSMPRWSLEEEKRLRSFYPIFPNLEVARRLGRSLRSIVSKASLLGLRKNPSVLSRAGRNNVNQRGDRSPRS